MNMVKALGAVSLLACIAGCGNAVPHAVTPSSVTPHEAPAPSKEAPAPAKPSNTETSAPTAAKDGTTEARKTISTIKVDLPSDWKREQGDEAVIFEAPRSKEAPPAIARIKRAGELPDASSEGFTKYMKRTERWDEGTKGELIGEAEQWPGGFAATYKVIPAVDPKRPKLEFLAVWKVGGELLECEGRIVPNETARDLIRAICKSARW